MSDRFAACLAETREIEGGWSDDPHDTGGPTNKGITIRVYAGHLGIKLAEAGGELVRDATFEAVKEKLRNIPDAVAAEIYRRNYWDACRAAELPAGIDFATWDYSVHSGPVQAIKSLQAVLGVRVDGHIGAATLGAVKARLHADLIRTYIAERRRFLRGRKNSWRFGNGWMNRCDRVEVLALDMAGNLVLVADPAALPPVLPDADAQAASQAKAMPEPPKPPWITEVLLAGTGLGANVTGFASAFGRIADMPAPTLSQIVLAFLREPLVLGGIVTTMCALTTWLWRRRVAAV